MSFPIPSFFKIRCGIIIIAFLLFFMFIGMLKQVLASCPSMTEPDPAYTLVSASCYPTTAATYAACLAGPMDSACDCRSFSDTVFNTNGMPNGTYACQTYGPVATPRAYKLFIHDPSSPSTCPDSDHDGTLDACDTCPKQQGYKTNLLIASYCGNTITQCDGSSHTSYEWGFGSDSCTPVQEPDCHVTADCKKDSNQDGIADGQEGGGSYSGNSKADLDGDGIPDLKDCDYDFDGDGKKNCEDPCPLKANPGTAICPDVCAGGTPDCEDADGDGVPDCTCPYGGECWTCADADYDGLPNGFDNDIDGDGIPNAQDSDVDGDGIPNADDPDDDGDGTPDDEEADPDTDGDGIPDSEDTDDDGDGIPDDEEEIATTPYVPKAEPYAADEDTLSITGARFGDRFQKFFTDMRATSVFSIPGQVFGDLPTGGSPSFMVNGGQTFGTHELSMESWAAGLAALRAVLYIIAGWGAVKIALLGK